MKKIFIIFICLFGAIILSAQLRKPVETTLYPVVKFRTDNQSDSVLIIKEKIPLSTCEYCGRMAGFLSPLYYWDNPDAWSPSDPINDTLPNTNFAWKAWLCTQIIPDEVKCMLDLLEAEKYKDSPFPAYIKVWQEFDIRIYFGEDLKIVQVEFLFTRPSLAERVSMEQLRAMYDVILEKEFQLPEDIYRLPKDGVEAEEYKDCDLYIIELESSPCLRWAKDCQEHNPKLWDLVLERFGKITEK